MTISYLATDGVVKDLRGVHVLSFLYGKTPFKQFLKDNLFFFILNLTYGCHELLFVRVFVV